MTQTPQNQTHGDLGPEYFQGMYDASDDPWKFGTRWYEQRKRALTMALLPRRRFRRALEPGCSTGLLTEQLAARCDEVIGTDVNDKARRIAAEHTAALAGVRIVDWSLGTRPWPAAGIDLLVLSEVGYYLSGPHLRAALDDAAEVLTSDAVIVSVHWRRKVDAYPLSGGEVQRAVRDTRGWQQIGAYLDRDVTADVLTRAPGGLSVAQAEGLS